MAIPLDANCSHARLSDVVRDPDVVSVTEALIDVYNDTSPVAQPPASAAQSPTNRN
jgi:hypothetical protein